MIAYVDTCVFRDYIEMRRSNLLPLFSFAEDFFMDGIGCKYHFMFSDWTSNQLSLFENHPIKMGLFKQLEKSEKILYVKVNERDLKMARAYDTDYEDAVHACIAMNNNASCIITRNIRHFSCFENDILVRYPEHIEDVIERFSR